MSVLLLFIITDSRTIKYITENTLDTSTLNYESIEGNIFEGLEIKNLSYEDKPLFSSALIYWNPLQLFYKKITITKVDVKGIELENILDMLNSLESRTSEEQSILDFSIIINTSHFDINAYTYEGVKFSSFVLETGKIEITKDFNINTGVLYLKFDSDIANVTLNGKVNDSSLLVDNLDLQGISIDEATELISKFKENHLKDKNKTKKESKNTFFLKEIKIKHILGTLKPIKYGDLRIKSAKIHLYEGTIDPANFEYQVKKVNFKGKTNFAVLEYRGHIKDSNIYAKGDIFLRKALFSKYSLPLNFKGLKKLSTTLHLNHEAVWIDIEHNIKKLLKIKNDFNVNFSKAKHNLHYDYKTGDFRVESDVLGNMTYAKSFTLKNTVLMDKKGFSYKGKIKILGTRELPVVISDYLLPELTGKFKGSSQNFKMDLDSKLLSGHLSMKKYQSAKLVLKSKSENIALNKLITELPSDIKNEQISLKIKSTLDFKNFKKSKLKIYSNSNLLDIEANMDMNKPLKVYLSSNIHNPKRLEKMLPNLNFSQFKHLTGNIEFRKNNYLIHLKSGTVKLYVDYDVREEVLKKGIIHLEDEVFTFQRNEFKTLEFYIEVKNIQNLLKKIQHYYDFDIPNIQGAVDLTLRRKSNGIIVLEFNSPKLQYLSTKGVDLSITNIYNINMKLMIDKELNIEVDSYQFFLDDNGYLSSFYSNKKSFLSLKGEILNVNQLWLNDKIEIFGEYNTETLIANLKIDANAYELNTKDFALVLDLDLDLTVNQEEIDIAGNIDILGDTITYELVGSDIVEDSDIIIVEEMLKVKESAFNDMKLYLKIKSKKALKYIADDVDVEFFNDILIVKNYDQEMLVTGVTSITKGYYQLEEKQFILDTSHLYFTGDVKSPLLDIKANYEKDQYTIHIFISGTTDAPIVNFNSDPYLTQQEILSLILFDGTGSSSGKGAEAYTLLGGSFAKGLIKSLGIDVDHLLLGRDAEEQLSLEVGKKISKDISILYLHKDGLDGVKVRMEHSDSFETDIIIQPPNTSSIEFLYKRDR